MPKRYGLEKMPAEVEKKANAEIIPWVEDWKNKTAPYESTTELESHLEMIPKLIKMGKLPQEGGKTWASAIENELKKRQGDPFWDDMTPKLDSLSVVKRQLTLEKGDGYWQKVSQKIREKLELQEELLMTAINHHRENQQRKKEKNNAE